MKLLEELCNIHAPAGEEFTLTEFLINYVTKNQTQWKVKPTLHYGKGFQDNIIIVFGKPRTAVFAHLDSIGFTVRYNNEIVKIGGPVTTEGIILVGEDTKGKIEGKIIKNKDGMFIDFKRTIERGTSLTFKVDFRNTDDFIQCCYMDNRLGVWNCLEVAKTLGKWNYCIFIMGRTWRRFSRVFREIYSRKIWSNASAYIGYYLGNSWSRTR